MEKHIIHIYKAFLTNTWNAIYKKNVSSNLNSIHMNILRTWKRKGIVRNLYHKILEGKTYMKPSRRHLQATNKLFFREDRKNKNSWSTKRRMI